MEERCQICNLKIVVMAFKGTGVCSELCYKARGRERKKAQNGSVANPDRIQK